MPLMPHLRISRWTTEERSRVSGQESAEKEDKVHGALVSAAKERELCAWKKFMVLKPLEGHLSVSASEISAVAPRSGCLP